MAGTPLLIGPNERGALHKLRDLAVQHPVDMKTLKKRISNANGKRKHMKQMTAQTVYLPMAYAVTFSIETGHNIGTCRHMSMSVNREGRVPLPEAIWMVAEELGFVGGIEACATWLEDLQGHGKAVNVVQPLSVTAPAKG